jgi:tryptophan synthase alpha subunit
VQKGGQSKFFTNTIADDTAPAFANWKQPALVTYFTAGYPTPEETVDILLAMEAGGSGKKAN